MDDEAFLGLEGLAIVFDKDILEFLSKSNDEAMTDDDMSILG